MEAVTYRVSANEYQECSSRFAIWKRDSGFTIVDQCVKRLLKQKRCYKPHFVDGGKLEGAGYITGAVLRTGSEYKSMTSTNTPLNNKHSDFAAVSVLPKLPELPNHNVFIETGKGPHNTGFMKGGVCN